MPSHPSEPFWEEHDSSEPVPPPSRVGPFHIEAELGRGTFAIVYSARQQHPARRVAVKVLRPDLDRGQSLRRFRREASVLARCQHPGIAQIHEAGEENLGAGRQHWIAMELVAGTPLTSYASDHGLDERARATLLLKLLEAVACAHDAGIVHRDLKPSNVLVTDAGQPKVIDFGVARVTGAGPGWLGELSAHTAEGQLLGTIPYMSPEQVLGADEVDERSDVYSIGVLGFELFTGRLPYDASGLSLVSAITEREPLRAGSVDPRLAGDVEAILCKALEKDPDERYASARAMAADLRRYLAHEPVSVRPPSLGYQLRKLARRNPRFVSSVAAAFVVLVLGFAGATFGLLAKARSARETSAQLEAAIDFSLQLFEAYRQEVRPRIGSREAQLGLLDALEPKIDWLMARAPHDVPLVVAKTRLLEGRATLAAEGGDTERALELLVEAEREAGRASRLAPEDIDAQRTLSLIEVRRGDLAKDLGDEELALELYLGALARDERLVAQHPDHPRLADDLCWSHDRVGHLLFHRGEHERAAGHFEEQHRLALDLVGWDPEPLRARLALCSSYGALVRVARWRGEAEREAELVFRLVELARELVTASPQDVTYRGYYAAGLSNAASTLRELGRLEEGVKLAEALLAERHFLAQFHGGDAILQFAAAGGWVVQWHELLGQDDEALRWAQRMVDHADRLAALSGSRRIELLTAATTRRRLAASLERRGARAEAAELRNQALAAYEALHLGGLALGDDLETWAAYVELARELDAQEPASGDDPPAAATPRVAKPE